MTEKRQVLARQLGDAIDKIEASGWNRVHGAQLIYVVKQCADEAKRLAHLEAVGRADTLVKILGEFLRDTPPQERLEPVLAAVHELAELFLEAHLIEPLNQDILPPSPSSWTFAVVGEHFAGSVKLLRTLHLLGFATNHVANWTETRHLPDPIHTVLLASATGLAAQPPLALAGATLVAVVDTDDFEVQVAARRVGASLLLDTPLDVPRLITALAGLAWIPRTPYRVLLVETTEEQPSAALAALQAAGFSVQVVETQAAAWACLAHFSPEVCVLEAAQLGGLGIDIATSLRRDKRFARLPVVYLSATDTIEMQLAARHAGGEAFFLKPVDARLLVAATMAQAKQFRLFDAAYSQRRLAWNQLKSLRSALDAHAIVSVTTPDGSIIDVNEKFCLTSGYCREELIGHNHRLIKSGRHPQSMFEEMWQKLSSGQSWHGEVQNRHKDGSAYWVQSSILPIVDEYGLPELYVSIRTDITEQKRIQEAQERQARLLDALSRALQHFMLTHNLASTSALLLDAMLLLTESAYGFIAEVLYEPDGTAYLKTHALSNVEGDAHTRQLHEDTQKKGMAFRNLDTLFGAVLRTGEVVIANDPTHDPRSGKLPKGHPPLNAFIGLPVLHANVTVGVVALANRAGGYDASTESFLSPLTATYATILEAARVRHLQQQVIDSLLRAKDAAEQANRRKTELLANWAGQLRTPLNAILGHAQILQMNPLLDADIAEQIQEIRHGGEVLSDQMNALVKHIDTDEFIATPTTLPKSLTVAAGQEGTRRRILVAEDNPANRAVLRMQLDVLGFDADLATDGTQALAQWQAGGHDLILADRHMPNMDGLALTRAIRAAERDSGGYVPIIAVSALNHPEDLAACRAAGMDDALPKPIELDDLRRLLARWLPRSSPVTPFTDAPQPSSNNLGATLDTNYLARIIGQVPVAQTRELVDLFTVTAHADLQTCQRLLTHRDGHGLSLMMHRLKSSARMVGAMRFAHLAESLESAAQSGRLNTATMLLTDLNYAVRDIEAVIHHLTPPLQPALVVASHVSELPKRVLMVDDDPIARRQGSMLLAALGIQDVLAVGSGEVALAELNASDSTFDLIISDLDMPSMDGIEFLRQLAKMGYQGGIILASGVDDRLLQTAADLTRAKGLALYGSLKKPMTQASLLALLIQPCPSPRIEEATLNTITLYDIQEGIRLDEFSVHFQPKVDAITLNVVGAEALARWNHNGHIIPPSVFIDIAERHGLIATLSEVLITKALIGGAQMSAAGFSIMLAVNISANWLSDIRLPEFILASIQSTNFVAENLILEITETGIMADIATSLDVMTRLRLKGFKLSIDDFGTGYSSIEQLQRIPFGELKLDRSFVQGAAENTDRRAILASTIDMARKLKLSTVAEGVETQADLDLIRGLGCDQIQGYFIAKPMPLEALLVWLKKHDIRKIL